MLASLSPFEREERAFVDLADQIGIEHVLRSSEYAELEKEDRRAAFTYRNDLIGQVVAARPAQEIFERAQALGLAWSPIRRPEENLTTRTSPLAAASRKLIIRNSDANCVIPVQSPPTVMRLICISVVAHRDLESTPIRFCSPLASTPTKSPQ
jgi:crotonobetainyl-CoA:carnitine CoA-transferase CaiB-like acyl-CoA transferase